MDFQEGVSRHGRQIHSAIPANRIESPKNRLAIFLANAQIEVHGHGAGMPIAQQGAFFVIRDVKDIRRVTPYAWPDALQQLSSIALAPAPVHDPDHLAIERLSRHAFLRFEERVLKLDDHAAFGLHVGDMLLASLRCPAMSANFIPIKIQTILPFLTPTK